MSAVNRLIAAGVPAIAGLNEKEFAQLVPPKPSRGEESLVLAVHPSFVSAADLAPLMERDGKAGFVVEDMTDLAEFSPTGVEIPDSPLYWLEGVQRGDEMQNWSPEEALTKITESGRTPLTISEGISWVLAQPSVLEPNNCFMTIGSRKPRAKGFDSRTPALWISGGTGRDGAANRGAAKVGWCWWRNRHTWLGFASTSGRTA